MVVSGRLGDGRSGSDHRYVDRIASEKCAHHSRRRRRAHSVGNAALGQDASSELQANRAPRSTASDKIGGQPALILYILMEAARPSPTFSR
jgi:hypothetical protein